MQFRITTKTLTEFGESKDLVRRGFIVGGSDQVQVELEEFVAKVNEANDVTSTKNRFKQFMLSVHNFHDTYRQFPFDHEDRI